MAADKLRIVNQVRRLYRIRSKPQVRNGYAAALLGVVNKVSLRVIGRLVPDDFDGVLVRANCAVGTKAKEYGALYASVVKLERFVVGNGIVGDVVDYAHREVVLGLGGIHVVEYALGHGRSVILGTQSKTPAYYDRIKRARDNPAVARLGNRRGDILVQGLSHGAELLRAVENGNLLYRLRNGLDKHLRAERAEHPHLENADFGAACIENLGNLLGCLRSAAHDNDYRLGIGRAHILVGLVRAPR